MMTRTLTRLCLLMLPIFGLAVRLSAQSSPVTSVALPTALADASARATAEKKLILLEFFSYNSMESKLIDDMVLTAPAVKTLVNDAFVLVRVEFETDEVLKAKYAVTKVPLMLVARPDGSEVDRIAGLMSLNETAQWLRSASTGRSPSDLSGLMEKAGAPNAGVEAHLALAGAYVKRARFADAVAEYNACLDQLAASSRPADLRALKQVLDRLMALSKSVPMPAVVDSLKTRRDSLEKTIGTKPSEGMVALFAMNEALKEPERNVAVYLKLPAADPLRETMFTSVFKPLVAARHYAEAVAVVDVESLVSSTYPRCSPLEGHAHEAHGHHHPIDPAVMKQRITEPTLAAVEALLATNHIEAAKRLAGRALDFTADVEVRTSLAEAATRSGGAGASEFKKWLDQYPMPVRLAQKTAPAPVEKPGIRLLPMNAAP